SDGGKLWAGAKEWLLPLNVLSITDEQGEDMDEFDQQPFSDAEFAENPEQRCPVILLLDTSYSMSGAPISELNEGLATLRQELMNDPMAAKRVELAMV